MASAPHIATKPPSNESLRRLSAAPDKTKAAGISDKGPAPSFFSKFFYQNGRRADIKILHEDVERTVSYAVRRNSLKKGGISEEEINRMVGADPHLSHHHKEEPYLIHPDSRYRLWWDMITAFYVIYLVWLVPFSIGFDYWYPSPGIATVNTIIDIWFIVDVILNFRTGYVDHGVMVLDSKRIMRNYLQSYFLIDFMASFPWETVFAANDSLNLKSGGVGSRKSLKLFKYFKLPKLMRISRMIRFFTKYARFYGLTLSVVTFIVAIHSCACLIAGTLTNACEENNGYYFNATSATYFYSDEIRACSDSFDTDNCETHLCATTDVYILYVESLFLAISMMSGSPLANYAGGSMSQDGCMVAWMNFYNATKNVDGNFENEDGVVVGSMDMDEVTCPINMNKLLTDYRDDNLHYIIVAIFMFFGVTQIAMLIGHLSLMLASKYQASAAFRMKLDRVKAECEYYKVPWDLQNRVFAYYDYLWVNQKQYDDKILLMNDRGMSSDLRGKLALYLYKDVIQGVSLFERVDDTFLSKICMELQTRVYLPQDWVILKGDIGSELYIISRGVVQVFVVDPMEEIDDDDDDDWGEEGNNKPLSRDDKRKNLLKAAEDESIFLRRGNFFGEVSLLMETRRTTSVQARTVTELNVLVQEVFEEILRESPEFANEMKNLVLERKLHNASTTKKRDGGDEKVDKNSGLHTVSLGTTATQIEAAVVDAIESRQLLINMRHAANFDEGDYDDAELSVERAQEKAKREAEEMGDDPIMSSVRSNTRSSFIKPIQDQIDKEEAENKKANLMARRENSKDRSIKEEKQEDEELASPAVEAGGASPEKQLSSGAVAARGGSNPRVNPHRMNSQGHALRSLDSSRSFSTDNPDASDSQREAMQDLISMQIATLQERTDKVFAMLTTKLGRVR